MMDSNTENSRLAGAMHNRTFLLHKSASVFGKTGNWRDGTIIEDEKKTKSGRGANTSGPSTPGPAIGNVGEISFDSFLTARPLADPLIMMQCKHCKKSILKPGSKSHIEQCLRVKKFKAQRKKEAREARERAKEAAKVEARKTGDDADDAKGEDDSDIEDDGKKAMAGSKAARKAASAKTDLPKGKKRKADADADLGPKPKKKKEETKPKVTKPKGPVDVEKQCGVMLPNGQQCARSLTCKSHSMGAKRAVVGRSLPYDMLLAAYQKKNQAKQQKAALDANATLDDDDDDVNGPVDSDEETASVMAALAQWDPRPVVPQPIFNTIKRQYQVARLHESLQLATNGGRINIFKVSGFGAQKLPDGHPALQEEEDAAGEPDMAIPPTPIRRGGPLSHVPMPAGWTSVIGHA